MATFKIMHAGEEVARFEAKEVQVSEGGSFEVFQIDGSGDNQFFDFTLLGTATLIEHKVGADATGSELDVT